MVFATTTMWIPELIYDMAMIFKKHNYVFSAFMHRWLANDPQTLAGRLERERKVAVRYQEYKETWYSTSVIQIRFFKVKRSVG